MENEIWKDIEEFKGQYQISNLGNVRSLDRYVYCKSKTNPNLIKGKILKIRFDKNGYCIVNLKRNQKSHIRKIHRLVSEAFILNPENLSQVNHKDGNKQNNHIDNLEWCTVDYNNKHRTINKLVKPILSDEAIIDIKTNCIKSKNQKDNNKGISYFANKYNVCRQTVSDIVNNKKLYLRSII